MSDTGTLASEGAGALLRRKRESLGYSVEDVAQAIKLQPRQIQAMEDEHFEILGGSTFVRGFMRNYAKLLDLDTDAVLAVLERQASLPVAELHEVRNANVRMPREGRGKPFAWLGAVAPLVVVAAGAAAYYLGWLNIELLRPSGRSGSSLQAASPGAASTATSSSPMQTAPSASPTAAESAVAAVPLPAAQASPAETDTVESALRADASNRLLLRFERPSWVEVKQADGHVLVSKLHPAGTSEVIEGRPPFTLIIGSASGVQLQYGDRQVDLRPYTRVDVARLTLE
jgi:cytoskeleton protein RodZ